MRRDRQMERGRERVENRAEDAALFRSLALPSVEAACAFAGILLRLWFLLPFLTSAILNPGSWPHPSFLLPQPLCFSHTWDSWLLMRGLSLSAESTKLLMSPC